MGKDSAPGGIGQSGKGAVQGWARSIFNHLVNYLFQLNSRRKREIFIFFIGQPNRRGRSRPLQAFSYVSYSTQQKERLRNRSFLHPDRDFKTPLLVTTLCPLPTAV